ncbi:leucine rich repeat (LRR) protein [Stackebrandtia endophytica]|uniref:Leucine rich repeat (LRR) protein n=1 Tax=Stackebrandtia endophytica TaxID=1496996 RepID=A0A543AR41_9ACTN|nr:hypothetical protein [Stackebrandtia endophytica]TQL75042.1 leucine rich repeat (LRR) protein [Stackebrandtia endophytica]
MTQPTPYRVIAAAEAEERFSVSAEVNYPYQKFTDEQEIRLHQGDLRITGDFESESDVDWLGYNTIVDGDLVVDGNVDWHDYGGGNFLLVTGNVTARNVILQGCPNMVVRGDLNVANAIFGFYGEDGGELIVDGKTTASLVVATYYFGMTFASRPDALIIADTHRIDCAVDFDDAEVNRVLRPEFLDDDAIETGEFATALKENRRVLRDGVKPLAVLTEEMLTRLVTDGATATELDLSGRRLTAVPPQVFQLPLLRRLDLSDNEIADLPEDILALSELEHLNLSNNEFEELPNHIGQLSGLRILEIESLGRMTRLPESIGDLRQLRRLNASMVNCSLPDSLDRLTRLTELDLSYWRRSAGPQAFPPVLTRLSSLTTLDIRSTRFTSLPARLANLRRLDELILDGALASLPDVSILADLTSLTRLHIDGRCPSGDDYPSFELLEPVWGMSQLVELSVDRFGRQTAYDSQQDDHVEVRPALSRLPDDLFDRLVNLRRLDLSFNDVTTLPESLYRLPHLEFVNLEYTDLDRATVERLGRDLPLVRLDLRNVTTRFDVEDPHWQRVHELVKTGAGHLNSDDRLAAETLEAALELCTPTAVYSAYDELYARYGLVNALGRLADQSGSDRPAVVERCRRHAEQILALVPAPGAIWHFTDEGAFQEECIRHAANALGWYAMEAGDLDEALTALEPGLAVADLSDHGFIFDTLVRVRLRRGERDAAYLIVDQILDGDPDFGDLQDLRYDADYLAWREAN